MSPEAEKKAANHTAEESPPRRRPWHRLHLSTWMVLLLVLAVLALIEVPGTTVDYWEGMATSYSPQTGAVTTRVPVRRQQHGWPLVYLERVFYEIDPQAIRNATPPGVQPPSMDDFAGGPRLEKRIEDQSRELSRPEVIRRAEVPTPRVDGAAGERSPQWLCRASWSFTGRNSAWYSIGLLLDVAVILLICLVVAAACERWRRSRRRFSQFGLRDLLVLATLTAAVAGWCRWMALEHARESETMAALEAEDFRFETVSVAPACLAKLVGVKHLPWTHRVRWMGCRTFGYGPEDVETVARIARLSRELRSLEEMRLGTMYDPAVLKPLEGSTTVLRLEIHGHCLSEEGVQSLATLPRLKELRISGGLWDVGFYGSSWEERAMRPAQASVGDPNAIDENLTLLHRLPALESLSIEGYWITNEGMRRLSRIESLRELELTNCGLVDEGLAHLADLARLERLTLGRCKRITDRSIVHLKKLTTLRQLDFSGTDITEAGAAELRKALPETEIPTGWTGWTGGGFF